MIGKPARMVFNHQSPIFGSHCFASVIHARRFGRYSCLRNPVISDEFQSTGAINLRRPIDSV
jgi:hypothetical protein